MEKNAKQYNELKEKNPGFMVLLRNGDFYETYNEDAQECGRILGVTVTKSNDSDMLLAGFPYHALDTYLPRLIRAGKRIAICDCIS